MKKKLVVTDTAGEEIRVCFAAIQRVMNEPVDVLSAGPADYALVACGELGVSIRRYGRTIQRAVFTLATADDATPALFQGAEGRDSAINAFLGMVKARKSFWPKEAKINGTKVVPVVPKPCEAEPLDDTLEQLDRFTGDDGETPEADTLPEASAPVDRPDRPQQQAKPARVRVRHNFLDASGSLF